MEAEEILDELVNVETQIKNVEDNINVLLNEQEKLYERQSQLKALLATCEASRSPVCPISSENWSGQFGWDSQADDVRFNVFGIHSYRANQRQVINAIMSGRDVLVIMAAGGGKSLCYQLPAILRAGIALVVSPLLSLIQDQVMILAALGISASMLTSNTSKEEEKIIYRALEKGEGEVKILYVTPEKVSKSKRFMSKLEKCHNAGRLSLIAIDEAHCCSQWGHDFRPDYKNLSVLKIQFPNVPLVALTATATQKVQDDLMEMLCIPRCAKFVSTVNRPNLFYMVREKSSVGKVVIDEIAQFIQESYPNNESGIVYCFSRKECQQVAANLRDRGISADYYHADMDSNAREEVHTRWSSNKLQVIVGTVAFGMGINKPDVRFVIHHSLSKSMETYYQESGRAGRDGLPSECILFFRPGDVPRQSSMVFYENCGLNNLYGIVRYCQSRKQCRRDALAQHFGEPRQDCGAMCDNCAFSNEVVEVDATCHAKLLISLLQDMQENDLRLTMLQLAEKMKNKQNGQDLQLKKEEIEQIIIQLIIDRVLKEEFQHTAYATNAYVTTGPLAKQVLQGNKLVKVVICKEQSWIGNIRSVNHGHTFSGLEFKLDELRKELSIEHGGIFPHSVLSGKQISSISSAKPRSIEELEKIVGKLKVERYGSRILEEIEKSEVLGQHESNTLKEEKIDRRGVKRKKSERDVIVIDGSNDEK